MRSNLLYKVFAIIFSIPLIVLIFGGCSKKTGEDSSQTASTSSSSEISSVISEASSAPEESAPTGEPTFLIGLDGRAILTSEITKLEATDKTAETLTEDDLYAEAYCDGFTYAPNCRWTRDTTAITTRRCFTATSLSGRLP